MRFGASLAVLCLLGLTASGCMQARSAATGCLSPDGQNVIKQIISDETEKSLTENAEGSEFSTSASSVRASLALMDMSIADIRTSKEDPDSTKRFCDGNLTLVIPNDMVRDIERSLELSNLPNLTTYMRNLGGEFSAGSLRYPIEFTVQPTDDGKSTYGEVLNANSVTAALSEIVAAHALRSQLEQSATQAELAQAEQNRLQAEAQAAELDQATADARQRHALAIQSLEVLWTQIPTKIQDRLTEEQAAFNRAKNADCALASAQSTTDPKQKEIFELQCKAQRIEQRVQELTAYRQAQ